MADPHPADGLINSIKGLFNGDNLEQAVRDAWDRMKGNQKPPQPSVQHDQQAAAMTKQANDAAVQKANKAFVDADAAARIRAKAAGK